MTNTFDTIVAYSDLTDVSHLAIHKAIQLGSLLHLDIHIRALMPLTTENGEMTSDQLNDWMDLLKDEESVLSEYLSKAEKNHLNAEASIIPSSAILNDHNALLIAGNDLSLFNLLKPPPEISYLVFRQSRRRLKIKKIHFFCEGELSKVQQKRINQLLQIFKDTGSTVNISLVEGRVNLDSWLHAIDEPFRKLLMTNIYRNSDDVFTQLKKTSPDVICIPWHSGVDIEKLKAIHKINKNDVVLF